MISRYDIMLDSETIDEYDNETYPDPLSIDYNLFTFRKPPFKFEPTEQFFIKPYIIMNSLYKQPAYDDIILDINNISHISKVFDFEVIDLPEQSDLLEFMKKVVY